MKLKPTNLSSMLHTRRPQTTDPRKVGFDAYRAQAIAESADRIREEAEQRAEDLRQEAERRHAWEERFEHVSGLSYDAIIHERIEATLASPRRTKEDLLQALRICSTDLTSEIGHRTADILLVQYIGDADIAEAFLAIDREYSSGDDFDDWQY